MVKQNYSQVLMKNAALKAENDMLKRRLSNNVDAQLLLLNQLIDLKAELAMKTCDCAQEASDD